MHEHVLANSTWVTMIIAAVTRKLLIVRWQWETKITVYLTSGRVNITLFDFHNCYLLFYRKWCQWKEKQCTSQSSFKECPKSRCGTSFVYRLANVTPFAVWNFIHNHGNEAKGNSDDGGTKCMRTNRFVLAVSFSLKKRPVIVLLQGHCSFRHMTALRVSNGAASLN